MTDLVALIRSRIGSEFDGECHLTEAEAEAIAFRISHQDAELERVRRELEETEALRAEGAAKNAELTLRLAEARNDEWKAAISAVQYMNANWFQDCRSDIERQALDKAAQSIIDELRRVGPTEYLDVQWKNAEDAVAAEERAEAAEAKLADARKAAFIEAADHLRAKAEQMRAESPNLGNMMAMIFEEQAASIRAKAEETGHE